MIKKLLLSFILCLNLLLPAYSVEDDSIIAPVAIFVKLGMITTPKWYDAFNYKSAFVQWDAKEKNKLAVFVYLGAFSDFIAHYNEDATDKKYDYRYDSGYVRQYVLEHDIPVALYKLAGDTIYQYDNNPDLKKGFLGFLGFCEDGPGHLISTTKILDDGSLVKFDSSGNKVISFKITDPRIISLYNSNDQKIGMFRLLTEDDVTLKPSFSEPVSDESFGIIIPIIVALANNNCFDDTTFSARVKNATSVSHYDSYGNSDGRFTISGNNISHYNVYNKLIAKYHIFGTSISHYDNSGNLIGTFTVFGTSISHYNSSGYVIDNYSISGNTISKRNAQGYSTESFSIFGDSVSHYNSSGYSVGSFSFF